jgi:hypothetical protein
VLRISPSTNMYNSPFSYKHVQTSWKHSLHSRLWYQRFLCPLPVKHASSFLGLLGLCLWHQAFVQVIFFFRVFLSPR